MGIELIDSPLLLGDLGSLRTLGQFVIGAATTVAGFTVALLLIKHSSRKIHDRLRWVELFLPIGLGPLLPLFLGFSPFLGRLEPVCRQSLPETVQRRGVLIVAIHFSSGGGLAVGHYCSGDSVIYGCHPVDLPGYCSL